MGRVVTLPPDAMDYALYGDKTHLIGTFLQHQLNQLPQQLTDVGQRIYNALVQSYNWITDTVKQASLKNSLQSQGIDISNEYIKALMDFEALQQANVTMQRYIMAQPDLRQLYLNNNVDGYSDTYENYFGNVIGDDHYDYRRVMDGVVQDSTDHAFLVKFFIDDLEIGDRELSHYEKVQILNTWDAVKTFLETCKLDFTSTSEDPPERFE